LITYLGTDGNIYIIHPDGENAQAVTKDANPSPSSSDIAQRYLQPTWSPDGQKLAFVGLQGGSQGIPKASLYTIGADGSHLIDVFTSEEYIPFYLYWTPDSQSISFLSNGSTEEGLVLHLAAASGAEYHILGVGQPFYWAWAPESDFLVIHTGGAQATNPQARLAYLSSVRGGTETSLDLPPGVFQAPDWSRDGNRIVVAISEDGEKGHLVLAGRDGGVQQTLVEYEGNIAFSISPDGRSLVYSIPLPPEEDSSRFMRELLWLDIEAPQHTESILKDFVVGYFWSPDSQQIAFFAPVFTSPDKSKESAPLPAEIQLGLFVTDVRSKEVKRLAVFSPTDAFMEILPFFDQYQRSITIWSPDSRHLVFSASEEDQSPGVFVVPSDGSSLPQRIAQGDLALWSWK
jgi:Tol biopolymer transport system component